MILLDGRDPGVRHLHRHRFRAAFGERLKFAIGSDREFSA
jgi:hypothetical protein